MTTEEKRAAQREYKARSRARASGEIEGGRLLVRVDCLVSPTSKQRLERLASHYRENQVWILEMLLHNEETAVLNSLANFPDATSAYLAQAKRPRREKS